MIAIIKYLKGCHVEDRTTFFYDAPEDRTKSSRLKVWEQNFGLNIRKNLFTVAQQCNTIHPRVLDSLLFEFFKQRFRWPSVRDTLVVDFLPHLEVELYDNWSPFQLYNSKSMAKILKLSISQIVIFCLMERKVSLCDSWSVHVQTPSQHKHAPLETTAA